MAVGRTEIPAKVFVAWLGIARAKFYEWKRRYGSVNEHNGKIPRDFWLEEWEREEILAFHDRNPLEGYRRLAYMMLDADVVAVSPSSVMLAGRQQEIWAVRDQRLQAAREARMNQRRAARTELHSAQQHQPGCHVPAEPVRPATTRR